MSAEKTKLDSLLEIIGNIAAGRYSNDIMELTSDPTPEPVRSIAEAMGLMMVKVEAREYQLELLVAELRELNEQIKRNSTQTIAAMVQALEARDAYTRGHSERVAALSVELAREMGLDEEAIELVRNGAILHDIGKIGCSDELFEPHDVKSSREMVKEIMKHPEMGAEILRHLDFLAEATKLIHAHHERPDGKGYPRKLTADEIPMGARIIAVADAFDAMTTDRPYQKGRTWQAALDILKSMVGVKWDADCVAAFERLQVRKAGGLN